jgi:hypothetical protein
MTDATYLSVGFGHACAILDPASLNAGLWCWGGNGAGELGLGQPSADSQLATAVTNAPLQPDAVACGTLFTCVLKNGEVTCWGDNSMGQAGNGTVMDGTQPALTGSVILTGASAIQAGPGRVCARLASTGGIKCWGQGPIGDGTPDNVAVPTSIPFAHCAGP